MDARLLAESAAIVAASSSHLIAHPNAIPDRVLHAYWQCARQRVQSWLAVLGKPTAPKLPRELETPLAQSAEQEVPDGTVSPATLAAALEDIFISEMLTRVTTAVVVAADQRRTEKLAEPIVRNAFVAYLDCRGRALQRLVHESVLPMSELARIERLRRRAEHLTAILRGPLLLRHDVAEFAFEGRRAQEYGERLDEAQRRRPKLEAWQMTLAALRIAFPIRMPGSGNPPLLQQRQIATSLACFPSLAFHEDGTLLSDGAGRLLRSGLHAETARVPQVITTSLGAGPAKTPAERQSASPHIRFATVRRSRNGHK